MRIPLCISLTHIIPMVIMAGRYEAAASTRWRLSYRRPITARQSQRCETVVVVTRLAPPATVYSYIQLGCSAVTHSDSSSASRLPTPVAFAPRRRDHTPAGESSRGAPTRDSPRAPIDRVKSIDRGVEPAAHGRVAAPHCDRGAFSGCGPRIFAGELPRRREAPLRLTRPPACAGAGGRA